VPNPIVFALVISFMLLLPMWCLAQSTDSGAEAPGVAVDQQGAGQSPVANSDSAEKVITSGGRAPISVEWNTKFAYSPIFRVAKMSDKLTSTAYNPNAVNLDDGDRNFHRGLVSNRVDVFSELNVHFGRDWGIRASTEAWGDPIYNQRTANNSPATWNALSSDNHHFAAGTKDFLFLGAYLLDAFASGNVHLGRTSLSMRGGQFAQNWGQTLFFGGNGLAGAMAPVDLIKLLTDPDAEFKEILRPVPQVSLTWQLNPRVSISGYYQFMWEATWMPAVGSYFSPADVAGAGAERALTPAGLPGPWLAKARDIDPKNSGQFGVQLEVSHVLGLDWSFFGAQFHEKSSQTDIAALDSTHFNPGIGEIGAYYLIYPQDVKMLGMSATKTVGVVNYAAEISGRWNQDLNYANTNDPGPFGASPTGAAIANNTNHILYPVGNTVHANLSAIASPRPNFISKETSFTGEVAWNHCISVTKNDIATYEDSTYAANPVGPPVFHNVNYFQDSHATRDAMAFMAIYSATYRQLRPHLDVVIPVALQFSPYGRSALGGFNTYHGGFFNVGANFAYKDANHFSITYQRFIGPEQGALIPGDPQNYNQQRFSYGQVFKDRNYIALSIYRNFGVIASQKKVQ
jgi:hypothetical protein